MYDPDSARVDACVDLRLLALPGCSKDGEREPGVDLAVEKGERGQTT